MQIVKVRPYTLREKTILGHREKCYSDRSMNIVFKDEILVKKDSGFVDKIEKAYLNQVGEFLCQETCDKMESHLNFLIGEYLEKDEIIIVNDEIKSIENTELDKYLIIRKDKYFHDY